MSDRPTKEKTKMGHLSLPPPKRRRHGDAGAWDMAESDRSTKKRTKIYLYLPPHKASKVVGLKFFGSDRSPNKKAKHGGHSNPIT